MMKYQEKTLGKSMNVVIRDIIKSPIAAFHGEGLQIYEVLEKALKQDQKIIISFAGIDHCATQFLNSSIGKLYLHFDTKKIDSLISFDFGKLNNLKHKIDEVKENAINSKVYDSLVAHASS